MSRVVVPSETTRSVFLPALRFRNCGRPVSAAMVSPSIDSMIVPGVTFMPALSSGPFFTTSSTLTPGPV